MLVRGELESPTAIAVPSLTNLYPTPEAVDADRLIVKLIKTFLLEVEGVIVTLSPVTSAQVPFVLVVENVSVLIACIGAIDPPPPLGVAQVLSPRRKVVLLAVPLPRRAVATVPLERLLALRVVRLAPEPLNVPAVSVSVVLL
jgi:hypothetical protein